MIDTYSFTKSGIDEPHKSPNEKSDEKLQKDTLKWEKQIQTSIEEIHFLELYLSANIFQPEIPGLHEVLSRFTEELKDIKIDKIDLQKALRHHKYDLNRMRECEDIHCDLFYNTRHQNILNRIQEHLSKFQELKLLIYRFSIQAV